MKTNKLFALVAVAALAFVSCSKENPDPVFEPSLSVNKTEKIEAPAEGTTATVKVTANITWTAAASQDWVTVTPASKSITDKKSNTSDLTIAVAKNETYESRTATVTLKAEGCKDIVLNISQAGGEKPEPKFNVTDEEGGAIPNPIEAECESSSFFVNVDANVDWTATSSDDSWLSINPASKESELTECAITWEDNNSSEAREGTITFKAEGFSDVVVTVSQKGKIPFTAQIDAMSVTEYIGQPMEMYPDWSCIITYVGMPSVPAVAGSYGIWKASVWADIINDWEANKEEAIAIVDEYGDALVEEDLEQINELEDEDAMAYWIFDELDAETEYIFVTKLVDAEGRVWIGYALHKTDAAPKSDWTLYGKGKYKDGYLSDIFGWDPKEIDVDIYQDSLDPTHFAVFNPYGPEMLVNWAYSPTVTLEQIIAAKGQVWDDTYYEFNIDATAGTAFVKLQPLGWISSNYGAIQAGMSYSYIPTAKAYYQDGKVTIDPEEGAVIALPALGKVYYANEAGDFTITMPAKNAVKKAGNKATLKQDKYYRCSAKYLNSKSGINFSMKDEMKYRLNLKLVK